MRTVNPEGINEDDELHFKNFKETSYAGHKKIPSAISWSPSGDKLVVAETSVKVWSFDLINGCDKTTEAKLHDNNVETVKFGSNNLFGTLSK
jgi:WD40 repeat protein